MEIFIIWIGFAVVVGVAANTRGRNGLGWFVLAILISPLLAGLLVLALPRASDTGQTMAAQTDVTASESTRSTAQVFEPDAVYAGIPYKVISGTAIDAMLSGGLVRFRTMDQFIAAADGNTIERPSEVVAEFDPKNPIFNPFANLPSGSRIERHFRRQVAFLPDGSIFGETDNGPHRFKSFEEWRHSIGK